MGHRGRGSGFKRHVSGERIEPCPYLITGCRYGDACRFSHLPHDSSDAVASEFQRIKVPLCLPPSAFPATGTEGQNATEGLLQRTTEDYPVLPRQNLMDFVSRRDFGTRLTKNHVRAAIFDRVAKIARTYAKDSDVTSTLWSLQGDQWLQQPINLQPLCKRPSLQCIPDVYCYSEVPAGTVVVDFANRHVGGGCFSKGFVQEEQLVAQSTDFAMRLHRHREFLGDSDAVSYEGVHIDAWWPRVDAAMKEGLSPDAIQPCCSAPLTILAVDAPVMRHKPYCQRSLHMLAKKVSLVYEVAKQSGSPLILSGLLGGGAFRGNRPLVLALHMLMQRPDDTASLRFHHPIFWSFSDRSIDELEQSIPTIADAMVETLRRKGVGTLGEALEELFSWALPSSQHDIDTMCPGGADRSMGPRKEHKEAEELDTLKCNTSPSTTVCQKRNSSLKRNSSVQRNSSSTFTSAHQGTEACCGGSEEGASLGGARISSQDCIGVKSEEKQEKDVSALGFAAGSSNQRPAGSG